jgi:hypothetical protein
LISRAATDGLTQQVRRDLLRGVPVWVSKIGLRFLVASLVAACLCCAGCWKKSGAAVVLGKDYVPPRAMSATPDESPSPAEAVPDPSEKTGATDEEEDENDEHKVSNDDMIGPPLDPRATGDEQWIVSVRMIEGGRAIDVRMDQPQWQKLKINDRVHVTYREGKYTGTVWSAEIN